MKFGKAALCFCLGMISGSMNVLSSNAFAGLGIPTARMTARRFLINNPSRQQRVLSTFPFANEGSSLNMMIPSPRQHVVVGRWGTMNAAVAIRGGSYFSQERSTSSSSSALQSTAAEETTSSGTSSTTTTKEEEAAPVEVFRKDYEPLPYHVSNVSMDFNIQPNSTTVTSQLTIIPSSTNKDNDADFVLDGDKTSVSLQSIRWNGRDLEPEKDYTLLPDKLILHANVLKQDLSSSSDDNGILETVVQIVPEENTQLSGLYQSGPLYCTQCEAMGFRRITYYPDRPDNMAVFDRIRVEAPKESCPILLSNGNLLESGNIDEQRHFAIWQDPFPKPSYLFCLVAGNLGSIRDSFTTASGRKVQLELFSEHDNVDKLDHAMESLKQSMKWDEDVFGLEYDLDLYNIVAVNDFNMGAMENKGLNVFNTAYILANPSSATDDDYDRVQGVIGHEYFHNWTGNRVTCRDWFQLTLKEGLTVFRDQEFTSDMTSRPVKRIQDVRGLRGRQFNEDAGPMAHPIRPESYISMDNFYTATVYSKGAEVIRMYQTLLTPSGFRKGMDLYFERHDGSAVTCDDFRSAMADANNVDLSQFGRWYSTPGTPVVSYEFQQQQEENGTMKFSLTLSQQSQSTEGPLHIPIAVGLLDQTTGQEIVPTTVLELKEDTQTFVFENLNVDADIVPSMLRGFSAPIKLQPKTKEYEREDHLAFMAARDTDGFNKWESGQKLFQSLIFQTMNNDEEESKTRDYVLQAFERTLADSRPDQDDDDVDYAIQAYAMTLPGEGTLAEEMDVVDPVAIRKARGAVKKDIARVYADAILKRYNELTEEMKQDTEFKVDAVSVGRRQLRNVLLDYLCSIKETPEEKEMAATLATRHFQEATGMTDKMASLHLLASMGGGDDDDVVGAKARDDALQQFYEDAKGDALVLNKWFMVQALADLPDVLDRVKALTKHPDFSLTNPNRCRSLISAFTMNSVPFHDDTGAGYEFLGDILLEVDALNPQLSSRMGGALIQWKRYDENRGSLMKQQLQRLADATPKLSNDLFEVVQRGLK